jgi:hypothetical protein
MSTAAKCTKIVQMSAEDFVKWMLSMGIGDGEAASLLGLHRNTVANYKKHGAPEVVGLACLALFHRLDQKGKVSWQT